MSTLTPSVQLVGNIKKLAINLVALCVCGCNWMDADYWALQSEKVRLRAATYAGEPGFTLVVVSEIVHQHGGSIKTASFDEFVRMELAKQSLCQNGYRISNFIVYATDVVIWGICQKE